MNLYLTKNGEKIHMTEYGAGLLLTPYVKNDTVYFEVVERQNADKTKKYFMTNVTGHDCYEHIANEAVTIMVGDTPTKAIDDQCNLYSETRRLVYLTEVSFCQVVTKSKRYNEAPFMWADGGERITPYVEKGKFGFRTKIQGWISNSSLDYHLSVCDRLNASVCGKGSNTVAKIKRFAV